MRRLGVAVVAAVGAVTVLLSGPGTAGAASPSIVWGATVKNTAKQTPLQAVQAFQTKVGRTLGATRDFLSWDSPFPTAYETGLAAQGTTILLSVASRRLNGTGIPWASVAAAQPGDQLYSDMVSWADRVRNFGVPMYVTFQHEPEAAANLDLGTNTQFIAAWQNWVTIFRAEGATNVKFMWITTAYAHQLGAKDRRQAVKWYPGDAYVDAIATDAYNWFSCRATVKNPWNSLAQLISGQVAFGAAHPTKELWLAEFASVEDPATPGRKAQWISDAEALFKQPAYAGFKGVLYFDLNKACDWRVETVPSTLAAFAAMGADPYYSG
jgi:hypothetical protein